MKNNLATIGIHVMDLPERVEAFLARFVSEFDGLLVAVSGGRDSMGLLSVILESKYGRNVRVAHVNHGLRESGVRDEVLVRTFCDKLSIPTSVTVVDTSRFAIQKRFSLERAARELRYPALAESAKALGCRWILTGHTMDDSAETVLMRMLDGGAWYEWTGIPEQRGQILRPLLNTRRSEIHQWVNVHEVPFHEDESNLDTKFRRNSLRAAMKRQSDFWSNEQVFTMAEIGKELLGILERMRGHAKRIIERKTLNCSDLQCLEIPRILTYFSSLAFVPIEVGWRQLSGYPEGRLSSHHRRTVSSMILAGTPESRHELPHGVTMVRRGISIWLYRNAAPAVARELGLDQDVQFADGIQCCLSESGNQKFENSVALSRRVSQRILHLRQWQAGDRIRLKGRPRKKVSDLMWEMKLNPRDREQAWVLSDSEGPLVLLGRAVDERAEPLPGEQSPLWLTWESL